MKEIVNEQNERVLQYVGCTFIRMPRKIATLMFSKSLQERYLHRLYVALIVLCFHSNGSLKKGKNSISCKAGELIVSYRDLANRTDIHHSTISNLISELLERKLIEIEPQPKGFRIRVLGYKQITAMRYRSNTTPQSSVGEVTPVESPSDESLNLIHSLKNCK